MGRRAKGEGSITQHAKGHWQAEFLLGHDENGKRKRKYITGRTQKEVREKLDALKQQLHSGTYSDTKLTLKQYLTDWLEDKRRQVEPKTLEGYTRTAKHLSRHLGGVQLSKITPVQIQRALALICDDSAAVVAKRKNGVAKEGAGVRTANQCRTNLHTALEDAVRMQLLMRNPVAATKPLKAALEEVTFWTPPQMSVFMDVARSSPLYALFTLAIGSGLRCGELLGLRWIDVEANAINVRQALKLKDNKVTFGPPKTKSSARRVPVSPDVIVALRAYKELQDAVKAELGSGYIDRGLVFTTSLGTPIHPRNLERTWYKLQEQARARLSNLPHGGLHTLRHFHASLAIRNGMDSKMLSDRLGHTDVRLTLNRYTHIWDEMRSASAVDISSLLTPQTPLAVN